MRDRGSAFAPAFLLFFIMMSHALLETARDALFLARLGADQLAWAYVAIAVVALLAMAILRRASIHDPRRLLLACLTVAVVGTTVLAATLSLAPSLVFVLYVWTGLVATLVVTAFWTALDRTLRVSEAKRSFSIIGAGGVLGAMVGSGLAGAIGHVLPARFLVVTGALTFAVTLGIGFMVAPRVQIDEPRVRSKQGDGLSRVSRRYVQVLISVGLLSTVVLTLVDLTFKREVAARFADADLATVFGAMYAMLNLVGLAIQLLVTPRLLARWGVGNSLMVLPLLILVTASGFALTGALVSVIALKLSDGGLRHSLHRVGTEILYLPLPAQLRDRWKPVADAISQRGGQVMAAVGWFAIVRYELSPMIVGASVAATALGWLVVLRAARRKYVSQFRAMLQAGEIERDVHVPVLDGDAIVLLEEALTCPDEHQAAAALELLARANEVPAFVLYHPHPNVVRRALHLLQDQQRTRADVARIVEHLVGHADPAIRAAALLSGSSDGVHAQLEAALEDANPDLRAAAVVGLADDGEVSDLRITQMVAGTTADRLALARAIGFAPHERFHVALAALLEYLEPPVIREVLRLWARVPAVVDLERLLGLLENAHVRGEARRVIVKTGRRGLERVIAALDDPRTPVGIRRHLPRTVSRFPSQAAAAALVGRLLREADGTTEFKILRALGRMRADDPGLAIDKQVVRNYVRRSVDDAVRYSLFLDNVREVTRRSSASDLMTELLSDKRRWAIEHTFRALGILSPRDGLRASHDAIVSDNESRRGAAREIVETLLPALVRVPLFAVLDNIDPDERRARLGDRPNASWASEESFLAALLGDPSESLKCLVAHHVAELQIHTLRQDLIQQRPAIGPPLVTYAFDQAIARLDA